MRVGGARLAPIGLVFLDSRLPLGLRLLLLLAPRLLACTLRFPSVTLPGLRAFGPALPTLGVPLPRILLGVPLLAIALLLLHLLSALLAASLLLLPLLVGLLLGLTLPLTAVLDRRILALLVALARWLLLPFLLPLRALLAVAPPLFLLLLGSLVAPLGVLFALLLSFLLLLLARLLAPLFLLLPAAPALLFLFLGLVLRVLSRQQLDVRPHQDRRQCQGHRLASPHRQAHESLRLARSGRRLSGMHCKCRASMIIRVSELFWEDRQGI
jgi:hypothetical protein